MINVNASRHYGQNYSSLFSHRTHLYFFERERSENESDRTTKFPTSNHARQCSIFVQSYSQRQQVWWLCLRFSSVIDIKRSQNNKKEHWLALLTTEHCFIVLSLSLISTQACFAIRILTLRQLSQ